MAKRSETKVELKGVHLCCQPCVNGPLVPRLTHLETHTFMMAVGVVEIVAGLLVAFRPHIGACVIALWLCGIIVNLLLIPGFYDIAMRDFGLLLGALALARLSREFGRNPVG